MPGLTVDGVDFHEQPKRIHFDLVTGLYDGLEYVGEDDDIPEAAGMDEQPRRAIKRVVELRGSVTGQGATLADRREDFHTALVAVFDAIHARTAADADDASFPVVVTGPYLGLPTGDTWTLNCRWAGHQFADPDPDWARRGLVIQLFSVDSPPDWVVDPA